VTGPRGLLFCDQGIPLLGQLLQFHVLLIQAGGDKFVVLSARGAGGLFEQLPDVISNHRDSIVEIGQRQPAVILHRQFSGTKALP
jgi:hypothetical protein